MLTTSKSAQHQCVDEEEFYDVDDHAAQRYLKRSQVRVHAEYVHELQETVKFVRRLFAIAHDKRRRPTLKHEFDDMARARALDVDESKLLPRHTSEMSRITRAYVSSSFELYELKTYTHR